MSTGTSRTAARGFAYAAGTPVALACLAGTVFVGGNLGASLFAWLYATLVSLPVAAAAVLVFGIPVYLTFRRLRITSLRAYASAGLVVSVAAVALELWWEYEAGYENANQALLEHVTQFVTLISGPAAAGVFWRSIRPDLPRTEAPVSTAVIAARPITRFRRLAVAFAAMAAVAFISYGTFAPHNYPRPLKPIVGEELAFDSTKAPDLVASLKAYAAGHAAHLGYYFMPTHPPKDFPGIMPPVLLMTTLEFPDGIRVIVNTDRKGLRANIYSETNDASDQTDRVWSDFIAFLRPAVDHANVAPSDQLPVVPWRGEGGKLESKWWDWRFQRE